MEISRKLAAEHRLILGYVDYLERSAYAWQSGGMADDELFKILAAVVDFVQTYADRYHHAKEEAILFARLALPGTLSHCNPIPAMLSEHAAGRHHIAAAIQAIQARERRAAVAAILAWADLLAAHIYKEDSVLYPLAEQALSDADKAELNQAYAQVERAQGGAQLESRYRNLLQALDERKADRGRHGASA